MASHRGEPGVGGEPVAGRKAGAVTDLGEDPGSGPRPDPGQGLEQPAERVSNDNLLDLAGECLPAGVDTVEFAGQFGDHSPQRRFGGHGHRLRRQGGQHGVSHGTGQAG